MGAASGNLQRFVTGHCRIFDRNYAENSAGVDMPQLRLELYSPLEAAGLGYPFPPDTRISDTLPRLFRARLCEHLERD
jgi:hypothetical protein